MVYEENIDDNHAFGHVQKDIYKDDHVRLSE
jgi:hypothetical protein